ncbi:hypothetical protein [Rhizosphaericola mali]|uniref:Uncharacterized protein n=1 Tax=Rhizosphaericola mali TaxID=2545455 RepID=A0A5P2FZ69_9BACT|nr:hypothetical protein [Rhizosphaericola mali]QES88844.1 hypothetical protein E0W69_009320 [Rhizosphaericola mali]
MQPSKSQLINLLENHVDGRLDSLVLRTNGLFEFRQFESDHQYIVRFETNIIGHNSIGSPIVDRVMKSALSLWEISERGKYMLMQYDDTPGE